MMEGTKRMVPIQSNSLSFCCKVLFFFSSGSLIFVVMATRNAAKAPMGRLMKNDQRQDTLLVKTPPTRGPIAVEAP